MIRCLVLLFVLLSSALPAWAHAVLIGASPASGGQAAEAPRALTLRFSEGVEARFCRIELRDAAGKPVAIEAAQAVAEDRRALTVPLPRLAPGVYTVIWHVTSVDTHKSRGQYRFTIKP
jgi:methionine-rich copper-binding protein CopC